MREFGLSKFNTLREFSTVLGMLPQSLQKYLNNSSLPGGELLVKLHNLGCDIVWLLTGKAEEGINNSDSCKLTANLKKQVELLKRKNIKLEAKLELALQLLREGENEKPKRDERKLRAAEHLPVYDKSD
jgi:transcriptional regulator with XRE-family HTH domain